MLDESILTPAEHPKFPSDTMKYRRQIYGEDLKKALDWLPLEEAAAGRSSGNVALDK